MLSKDLNISEDIKRKLDICKNYISKEKNLRELFPIQIEKINKNYYNPKRK